MKIILLIVLVLALAGGGAYYFYFKDQPLPSLQGPEIVSDAKPKKKDFRELSAKLQACMDHLPVDLHAARQMPDYALDTRSKLAPHLQRFPEYVTLSQVCDLIIGADQAFADHREKCGFNSGKTEANPQARARPAETPNPAVYEAHQTLWNNQRAAADSKVRQLLATLENRRL